MSLRSFLMTGALVSLSLSNAANAAQWPADKPNHFNYDTIEGAWADLNDGLDGFSFKVSHDIRQNLAITGGVLSASQGNADYDLLTVGAAYHFKSLTMTDTDVVLHGSLVRADNGKADTGIRIGAKLRVNLQPGVEVFGDLSVTSADEAGDSEILITPGLAVELRPDLDAVASYEASDREWLSIGLRYHY